MKIIASNKKAFFNYFLEDSFEAGIVLIGSEVKSLREGKCSLIDAFVSVENEELWLKNCEIASYDKAVKSFLNPTRIPRKLLMHKVEIKKLKQKLQVKGYTLIPTKIYFNDKGKVKLEIKLAKGKQFYDKKESIKEKDIKKETERELKGRGKIF